MTNDRSAIDVIDQLKLLGEAAEQTVLPVDIDNVVLAPVAGGGRFRGPRFWGSLAAAAAAAAMVVAVVVPFARPDSEDIVIAAPSQTEAQDPAAAPEPSPDVVRGDALRADGVGSAAAEDLLAARRGWQELRQCESQDDYDADSGNSFYGAYQFDDSTWRTVVPEAVAEHYDYANNAPPAIQDAAAALLFDRSGDRPWPMCGRFVTGPLETPVVQGWLDDPIDLRSDVDLIVFMDPELDDAGTAIVQGEVTSWAATSESIYTVTYVDKEAAFEEFRELFADSPELIESTSAELMAPSFRVTFEGDLPASEFDSTLDGVRRVVAPSEVAAASLNLRGVTWQVGLSDRLSASGLMDGPVMHSPAAVGSTIIAGHGSVPSDPFYRLDELAAGEVIVVHQVEERRYVVDGPAMVVNAAAPTVWPGPDTLALTTVGPTVDTRLVVFATPVESFD